jgi:hypothetical protein
VLTDIEPRVKARVQQLIARVGEAEFRRCVAEMTGFDIAALEIDDVICVYVFAKQGRIGSPEVGRRAAARHQTLPDRTDDDAGFTDTEGRRISKEDWERQRSIRRRSAA